MLSAGFRLGFRLDSGFGLIWIRVAFALIWLDFGRISAGFWFGFGSILASIH